VLTSLHFGEYIESSSGKWFYIGMNPYHIIGIIAFSTLIYASLVTGLVWLGMSLFYSMVCIYGAAFWLMFSMQHRAKQECAGRDRRYRPAELANIGSFYSGFADTFAEPTGLSSNANNSSYEHARSSREPLIVEQPNSLLTGDNTASLLPESKRKSIESGDADVSDVREYVEHLRKLRGAQQRSIIRASVRQASGSRARSRAGFKSTAALGNRSLGFENQNQIGLGRRQTSEP